MPAETKQSGRPAPVEARCVRLLAKAETPASLARVIEQRPVQPSAIYPLEEAKAAYLAVAGSTRDRIIPRPSR